MNRFSNSSRQSDYIFLSLVILLIFFGLVFLSSASSVVGFQKFHDSYYYLKHQLINGLLPGLVLFIFFAKVPYQYLKRYSLWIFLVMIISMLAVFVPGIGFGYGGARRWLNLGFIIQPSEFTKLFFLIYLAAWLESRGAEKIRKFKSGLLPFALMTALVLGLIILQPDLGTMSVVAVSAVVVYFVAGANWRHLLALGGFGLLGGWYLINSLRHSLSRLTVFLHPELDPQGIGYHISQALLAVGSGGFFGLGLGYSRQKYQYLPEVTGDSIFAIMAEELGFLLTVLFLILFFVFLWRGFRIARYAPDAFGRFLAVGIMTWLGWQTCLNIASMLSLLPLTGVPLPFVSYGGSALTATLAALGIMINLSRQAKLPHSL